MSYLRLGLELFQMAGAILAVVLSHYYIKEIRSKRPDVSLKVKEASVFIGQDVYSIEDPYTGESDTNVDEYSDFKFNIEFQNKGYSSTYITDIKLSLSNTEPKIRSKPFQFFEIPKRQPGLEYKSYISFYCEFTPENNPITLEFTTLDGRIIKEIVEIDIESVIYDEYFSRWV